MTTNEYIKGVKSRNWSPFNKRLWQRNYYECILWDEDAIKAVSRYIHQNPKNWKKRK